jgi:hypothetical protein
MAELERMVTQKVQSLHERVKAKEDTFRVRTPHHQDLPCTALEQANSQSSLHT